MKIRIDIADALRAGGTDRGIAAALGCDRSTVAKTRKSLNIGPAPKPAPANRSALTIEEKWHTFTEPTEDGHLLWTGRTTSGSGSPVFKHRERDYSALKVAFMIRTGKEPDGYAKAACERKGCVLPEHVDDTAIRTRDREALAALTGRWHRQETHCRRGHIYSEHGRYFPDGSRYCGACTAQNKQQKPAGEVAA